jgi:hypothetical protein
MATYDNPKNWVDQFEIIRKGHTIEIWIPPVNDPEGELVTILDSAYIPSLISSLKKFEQKEGR